MLSGPKPFGPSIKSGKMISRLIKKKRSSVSRALGKGCDLTRRGTVWIPHNELSINFWNDKSINYYALRSLIHGPLNRNNDSLMVADVWYFTERWKFENFEFVFSQQIKGLTRASPM